MIEWKQTTVMYSGTAQGLRFTMGTAGTGLQWWWTAFDPMRSTSAKGERKGWAPNEFTARAACEAALDELLKHTPKQKRTA